MYRLNAPLAGTATVDMLKVTGKGRNVTQMQVETGESASYCSQPSLDRYNRTVTGLRSGRVRFTQGQCGTIALRKSGDENGWRFQADAQVHAVFSDDSTFKGTLQDFADTYAN